MIGIQYWSDGQMWTKWCDTSEEAFDYIKEHNIREGLILWGE